MAQYERRDFAMEFKVEQRHRSAPPTLVGHAAVFNQTDGPAGWREKIAPTAFDRALREGQPVTALWNHNPDYVIASTKNGSLRLSVDKTGLVAEMDPIDTPTIRDLVVKPIQEGMVNKMSFGFETVKDEMTSDDDGAVRILRDVNLFDVSPVVFPWYDATDIQSRLSGIVGRMERALPLTADDQKIVQLIVNLLSRSLPKLQEEPRADGVGAGALDAELRGRMLALYEPIVKGLINVKGPIYV